MITVTDDSSAVSPSVLCAKSIGECHAYIPEKGNYARVCKRLICFLVPWEAGCPSESLCMFQENFWGIYSRPCYFWLAPLWDFQGGFGCAHIAGRGPQGLKRGVALYNLLHTPQLRQRCQAGFALIGMNVEPAFNIVSKTTLGLGKLCVKLI